MCFHLLALPSPFVPTCPPVSNVLPPAGTAIPFCPHLSTCLQCPTTCWHCHPLLSPPVFYVLLPVGTAIPFCPHLSPMSYYLLVLPSPFVSTCLQCPATCWHCHPLLCPPVSYVLPPVGTAIPFCPHLSPMSYHLLALPSPFVPTCLLCPATILYCHSLQSPTISYVLPPVSTASPFCLHLSPMSCHLLALPSPFVPTCLLCPTTCWHCHPLLSRPVSNVLPPAGTAIQFCPHLSPMSYHLLALPSPFVPTCLLCPTTCWHCHPLLSPPVSNVLPPVGTAIPFCPDLSPMSYHLLVLPYNFVSTCLQCPTTCLYCHPLLSRPVSNVLPPFYTAIPFSLHLSPMSYHLLVLPSPSVSTCLLCPITYWYCHPLLSPPVSYVLSPLGIAIPFCLHLSPMSYHLLVLPSPFVSTCLLCPITSWYCHPLLSPPVSYVLSPIGTAIPFCFHLSPMSYHLLVLPSPFVSICLLCPITYWYCHPLLSAPVSYVLSPIGIAIPFCLHPYPMTYHPSVLPLPSVSISNALPPFCTTSPFCPHLSPMSYHPSVLPSLPVTYCLILLL